LGGGSTFQNITKGYTCSSISVLCIIEIMVSRDVRHCIIRMRVWFIYGTRLNNIKLFQTY